MSGGASSRIFPVSPESIEEIRLFVDGFLERALGESRERRRSPAAGDGTQWVQLTIRVYAQHVEVTVGPEAGGVMFKDWLGVALRREGLSQESAARRIGVSLKTVNRWLRGHSEPRLRELRRVREVFGEPPL